MDADVVINVQGAAFVDGESLKKLIEAFEDDPEGNRYILDDPTFRTGGGQKSQCGQSDCRFK